MVGACKIFLNKSTIARKIHEAYSQRSAAL
uniref:Uncharacterized protein n=1 Tax=Rhizophora mucronata TaxID=61149 RepID=A0A2P2P0K1_RHIMU